MSQERTLGEPVLATGRRALRAAPAPAHTTPLLSEHWFRFATLRPRLSERLSVQRVSYRREAWYVLENAATKRSFRVNGAAYAFIGRCTGARSVQALWEAMLAEHRDEAPTQDELLQLLARLHGAGLLEIEWPRGFAQAAGGATNAPAEAAPHRNSLLSLRIPLGRPEALLAWLAPHLGGLFTGRALALWAACVLLGACAAALNAEPLIAHARLWAGTPRMLLLALLAYPGVKALHELGHALALRHFGARVPGWGITLMMFAPVPYVDGSAAASLPSAAQRLVVSAAGIMVELWLAALALLLALALQPGWLHDLAFSVFLIGSVSTLLVNGNPLMRFDGYHALTDLLQLPNLGPRSARWWIEHLRARVLGAPAPQPLLPAVGETGWLWAYAPASLAYRLVAGAALVGWLGHLSWALGLAIAAYLLWGLAGRPLLALWRFLRGTALDDEQRSRAGRRAAALAGAGIVLFACVPLPHASVVQGIVWLPEAALVRTETDGFIQNVAVRDGQTVVAGDPIFTLESPALEAEVASLQSRVEALDVERFGALARDPERATNLDRELEATQAALDRATERQAHLVVRAGAGGRIVVNHAADLSGRFVKQGELLAHVIGDAPTLVRAAIPQEEAALIRRRSVAVSVSLADDEASAWPAVLRPQAEGTVARLPSAALGDHSGGSIVTDPLDKRGLTPAEGVVMADVQLARRLADRVGGRAWVRFDHGLAPLALQLARRVQQLVLRQFNPAQ